jgi:hypothetical protein
MAAQANEAILPFSMANKDKDTDKDNEEEEEVNEEEKVTNPLLTTANTAYIHHPLSGSTTVEEEVERTILAISSFGMGLQGGAQRPVHQIALRTTRRRRRSTRRRRLPTRS